MLLNSMIPLPAAWLQFGVTVDNVLLAMAMAALGLTMHVSAIRRAGLRPMALALALRPMALALALCLWLLVGGFVR